MVVHGNHFCHVPSLDGTSYETNLLYQNGTLAPLIIENTTLYDIQIKLIKLLVPASALYCIITEVRFQVLHTYALKSHCMLSLYCWGCGLG